jgi:hypothetical protein
METQVRTPQAVFTQPQRLMVPLFQRPYIWSLEQQWLPLWKDLTRVAERQLRDGTLRQPHFLGAVVLQQAQNKIGSLQERVIIDGQQRLTTLQLLLDALQRECRRVGADRSARKLRTLIENDEAYWDRPEDRFKVWPTNRDRAAFDSVMSADDALDHSQLAEPTSRIVEAHEFFTEKAKTWLAANGPEDAIRRGEAIERCVRDMLQLVVIELDQDENAQEIFETLNARATPLTAADLIKNFIFQRLLDDSVDVEAVYEGMWREFESGFWETMVQTGRINYPRSALFLNQWLIAKTGDEIVARELFARFKSYALEDSGSPMFSIVEQIDRASNIYREAVEKAANPAGDLTRVQLFVYRTTVMESEVVKPLLLWLLDSELPEVPKLQVDKSLGVLESWLVRRMLVRATSQSYTQVVSELIAELNKSDRSAPGDVLEQWFRNQHGDNRYWPDDDEMRREVSSLLAYRRLRSGRLRMVLEAIEDHLRGFGNPETAGMSEQRVTRGTFAVEHVMPRKWDKHWPVADGQEATESRDRNIHLLGNLTLLTAKLNSSVSNGPWQGKNSKRDGIEKHSVLHLNRELLQLAGDNWTEAKIVDRTGQLVDAIVKIWPVPEGHRSGSAQMSRVKRQVELRDLLSAGLLDVGQTLYPRNFAIGNAHVATVLSDGSLDVGGEVYATPSGAAQGMRGVATNGWWFFLAHQGDTSSSIHTLRLIYAEGLIDEVDVSVGDEDEELFDDA